MMTIRNAKIISSDSNIVDVEIDHPIHGFIPYTFNRTTPNNHIDDLIEEYLTIATIQPYKEPTLNEVKASLFDEFFAYADEKEEAMTVDTTLGITVKGNAAALQAFTLGAKRGVTTVRDSNYQEHNVSVPQMNQILQEIEDNAIAFFALKGQKFDEIMALPDVASCEAYNIKGW